MASYREITQKILLQAQRGGEKAELANLDTQTIIEAIMPSVLQDVTLKYAGGDSDKQSLLRQTHTVTLTNGVGTLPGEVLTSCVWGSMVNDPDEPTTGPLMSYAPWASFVGPTDTRLGYYSIRGNAEFYWADPGESYPDLTHDGDVEVTIATALTIPATETETLTWPMEAQSDVVDLASEILRGMKVPV